MSIAANRHPGIYCTLCHDVTTARLARQHNNANILALGGRMTGPTLAEEIFETFVSTPFLGGRYQDRIGLIDPLLKC
jgi:RpiB/LacA/LacB family sugar-phosphate isomerase